MADPIASLSSWDTLYNHFSIKILETHLATSRGPLVENRWYTVLRSRIRGHSPQCILSEFITRRISTMVTLPLLSECSKPWRKYRPHNEFQFHMAMTIRNAVLFWESLLHPDYDTFSKYTLLIRPSTCDSCSGRETISLFSKNKKLLQAPAIWPYSKPQCHAQFLKSTRCLSLKFSDHTLECTSYCHDLGVTIDGVWIGE
jgi:hypothetical protein